MPCRPVLGRVTFQFVSPIRWTYGLDKSSMKRIRRKLKHRRRLAVCLVYDLRSSSPSGRIALPMSLRRTMPSRELRDLLITQNRLCCRAVFVTHADFGMGTPMSFNLLTNISGVNGFMRNSSTPVIIARAILEGSVSVVTITSFIRP